MKLLTLSAALFAMTLPTVGLSQGDWMNTEVALNATETQNALEADETLASDTETNGAWQMRSIHGVELGMDYDTANEILE